MIRRSIVDNIVRKTFNDINFITPFEISNIRSKSLSFNIRIPFCRTQCSYCLFRNYPWHQKLGESYLRAVKKEIEIYSKLIDDIRIESVYFSGGTPTVMPEGVAEIVEHVEHLFDYDGDALIEANPIDLHDEVLEVLINAGVRKISIGVQSFDDNILKTIGRGHDCETAIDAIQKVKEYDFDYVNIDLMFSLPEQNIENLKNDLDKAIELDVQGISTYPLILIPGTKIHEYVESKLMKLPSEKMEQEMYDIIRQNLNDHGYEMRALWSFSKQPRSYHGPFEFEEYVGLGTYAWSIVDKLLYLNTPYFEEYVKSLKEEKLSIKKGTVFSSEKLMKLWFMRKLYMTKVNKAEFFNRFKKNIDDELRWIILPLRLMGIIKSGNEYVELEEKGLFYASTATKELSKKLLPKFQN